MIPAVRNTVRRLRDGEKVTITVGDQQVDRTVLELSPDFEELLRATLVHSLETELATFDEGAA